MTDDYISPFDYGILPPWSAGHTHDWVPLDADWLRCTVCEQQIPGFVVVGER